MIKTDVADVRWSLEDLLQEPVESSLESALAELEALVSAFEADRDKLTDDIDPAVFYDLLGRYEAITRINRRVGAYASLWFATDTQNPAALNFRGRVDHALTNLGNRTLFFTLWIQGMDDGTAARLLPGAGDLRYWIEAARKFKPHTLSEKEEQVINLKDPNGIDAMMGIYDMITNKFTFELELDGEMRTLTRDQMTAQFRNPSAAVREAVYRELQRVYIDNSTVLAQMYNHRVRDWATEGTLRGFATPISARNLMNDLPDAVVDALLEVCRRNSHVYQRYFKLKAGWLGMDRLRRYDIYAPLAKSDKAFAYEPAVQMTLESFERFSPQVAGLARRVFEANHVDATPRRGKRGGAFCMSTLPEQTPWVLLNHAGKARDVATMAHELGHAIHAMLASGHSVLNFHAPLPLAETASVFSEMLLTDRLLSEETDAAVRRDLLAGAIDDAYATVQRQVYFTLFEREAHRLVAEGADSEALCEAYMDNLRLQFGDSVDVADEFRWEWISVPHIYHVPFYTYAYSFGQLLVFALYRQYQQEGESFVPRYLRLLSYGGSEEPARILQEAGFDVASPDFWQGGYDVLSQMIDDLETL
jgi:oligoendopeptidase F